MFFLKVVYENLDGALLLVTGGGALALLGLSVAPLDLKLATVEWIGFFLLSWSMGQQLLCSLGFSRHRVQLFQQILNFLSVVALLSFLRSNSRFNGLVKMLERRLLRAWVRGRLVWVEVSARVRLSRVRMVIPWVILLLHMIFVVHCLLELLDRVDQAHVLLTWDDNCARRIAMVRLNQLSDRKLSILDRATAAARASWLNWMVKITGIYGSFCPCDMTWSGLVLRTVYTLRRRVELVMWWGTLIDLRMMWISLRNRIIVWRVLRWVIVSLTRMMWMAPVVPIIILSKLLWALVHRIWNELSVWIWDRTWRVLSMIRMVFSLVTLVTLRLLTRKRWVHFIIIWF